MRNKRAKLLHQQALANPSPLQTAWYGKTLVRGGIRRAYKDLKRMWRTKGGGGE